MPPSARRTLLLALLVPTLAGCAEGVEDDPLADDTAPLVKPRVRALDEMPEATPEILEGAVVVANRPSLAEISPGDVLVSARGGGLLRKVTSKRVDGDRITLTTEAGSIEDVFEQASLRGRLAPPNPADDARELPLPPLEIKDKRVALGDGSEIEIAYGYFSFTPKLDLEMKVKRGKVERFTVAGSGETHAKVDVRYHLAKSEMPGGGLFRRDDADGVPLAEAPPVFATFWVGYVPVVVTVRARLLASWKIMGGGDVTGEEVVSLDGAATAGAELRDGVWANVSSKAISVSRKGDASLDSWAINGELRLTARLDVRFYEMVGPFVGLQAYTGVIRESSPSGVQWFTHRGLRGLAGAQVAPFGKKFIGYEAVVFDVNDRTPLP